MTIVNDPQDGYKGLFIDKESLYTENFDFSNFRERQDVYNFVLGEGPLDCLLYTSDAADE